jgi:hypothetical protein
MSLFVVSSLTTIGEFKKSKYFRQNLGMVSTIDKGGRRVLNEKDKFAYHYNSIYKTTIYSQGYVGDIRFYADHYITDDSFALYGDDFQEFIFQLDRNVIREKGIDFYIGSLIKQVEEKYEQIGKDEEDRKKLEIKEEEGNPELVILNPGSVTYKDLKAYLEKKNKERYKG